MMGAFRNFWARLRRSSAMTPVEAAAPGRFIAAPETVTAMRVSDMALAEANAAYGAPLNPWRLPDPPQWLAGDRGAALAMDRAGGPGIADLYGAFVNGAFSEGLGFLGYPYLAELSQRPEYRRVSEIWASEATRKWIKLSGDQKRVDAIEAQMKRFKVRDRFRRLAELDGFFGRAQLYIDLGHDISSPELSKPLIAKAKVRAGAVKNFRVVEPFWSYPGDYESGNPLAPDFYAPRKWYVMAGQVHASRLLTIVGREMPDMLKPAYSFGGLSLSQMIKPYVDNWLRSRQSVSDLLHSFSTMVLATDMSTILAGGAAQGLLTRLQLFNQTRDNRGVMAINKESEELTNVSTPLGTLDKLLAQSQEQIASVSGIPLVVLLGVTPSGLNASSDGEIRTFYATIKAYQERVFRDPVARVLEILQRDLDGEVDETITFEFVDLWEMPEADKAAVRKSDGDLDVAYVGAGIVSNEEVRARIVQDEDSPYFGMELSEEAPDPDPLDDGAPDDGEDDKGPGQAQDAAEFKEDQHPRREDGKFGSGGGGASVGAKPEKPAPKVGDTVKVTGGRFGKRIIDAKVYKTGGKTVSVQYDIPGVESGNASVRLDDRGAHIVGEKEDAPAPAAKPAKPPHPKVAAVLGEAGLARVRELIADKGSKAADVLAALKPLDEAAREVTPTLPHDTKPDHKFWKGRRYQDADGQTMKAGAAKAYLRDVAAAYADKDDGVGLKSDKQARILLGPPAAGKSTSAEEIARSEGYAIVDGDDAKKVIPEFDGGVGASAVHEESGALSAQVLLDMLDRGDNVILPLVGASPSSIEKRIALLKAKGYSVTVDLVDVKEDEAARRMASRALRTGRHIASSYFASIGDGPLKTYEHLKAKFKDMGFGRIDGNGGPKEERYIEASNHPRASEGFKLFG